MDGQEDIISDGDLLITAICEFEPFAQVGEFQDLDADKQPADPNTKGGDHGGLGIEDVPDNDPMLVIEPLTGRFKVSSAHMAATCPRYKTMIGGRWTEHSKRADGFYHWDIEVVDLEAFRIILNVIHNKNRSVPRSLDLEMLAKTAVIVEDLECYEAVEVFADIWIQQLRPKATTKYSRDMVMWLFISFVFHETRIFKSVTKVAIKQSKAALDVPGLPIRGKIIEMIEDRRNLLIKQSIAFLHKTIAALREDVVCSYECDCIILGALTKEMHTYKLLDPLPSEPFFGLSFAEIVETITKFRSPNASGQRYYNYGGCTCSLSTRIRPFMESLGNSVVGLELESDLCYLTNGSSSATIVGKKEELGGNA